MIKKCSKLELLDSLGRKEELDEDDFVYIKEFIRTVLYSGKPDEDYIGTRVRIYENLKVKSSMPLPPDPLSVVQVIKRAHHETYTWYNCDKATIQYLSLENNGWLIKDGKVEPLWFIGNQFPPSINHRRGTKVTQEQDGSEADVESEADEPPPRKRTRSKAAMQFAPKTPPQNVQEHPEAECGLPTPTPPTHFSQPPLLVSRPSSPIELYSSDNGIEGDADTDDLQTENDNPDDDSESDWEVSDFFSSDESCDEWAP